MESKHQMFSLARAARGLSQDALAKKMEVSQSRVSDLEAGRLLLDGDLLDKAAAALDVPADFFCEMPPRHATDTSPFHHRKLQSVGANKLGQIHARLRMMQMQIEKLLRDDVSARTFDGFKPLEPESYRKGAKEVAQLVRSMWSLPVGPVENLVEFVESAGAIVITCNFEGARIDGLSRFVPDMPPIIYLDHSAPGDRTRRTLAHEVAHLVMHVGRVPSPELEAQADEFASEFLLPEREIRRDLVMGVDLSRLVHLKRKWGVSMASLIMRAAQLGIITEPKKRSLFVQLSDRGWRTSEPGGFEQEKPKALRRIIEDIRGRGLSLEDLARIAKCSHREFCANYYPGSDGMRLLS